MKSEYLLPYLLFPAVVVSQRIPDILSSNPQLSSLASYVASFPRLAQQFKTADNFTFLAPTNEAFATWLRGNHSSDYIEATLTYHLLNGSHPSASLSSTPLFIPTALTNTTYCNVTGGQRVKALNDGRVVFGSALDTNSTVLAADIIATGGIVHIIDTILYMPFDDFETVTALNLSYLIALGNEGGLLSVEDRPFLDSVVSTPELTWFVANSPEALANLNVTVNQTVVEEEFKYVSVNGVVYSTEFEDGMALMSDAGLPLLITVRDGDTWINTAKLIGRDNLVFNSVFHVVDDLLNPSNITRPSFPSNISISSTATSSSPSIQPTDSSAPYFFSQPDSGLTAGVKTGIGVGVVGGVIVATVTAALIINFRKRHARIAEREAGGARNSEWKLGELSSNHLDEMPQLETTESAIELPAGFVPHVEIGRAF